LLRKFYLLNKDNQVKKYKYLWLPFISWFIYGLCIILLYIAYNYGNITLIEVFWDLLYIAYNYGNITLIEVFWDTGTTILIPVIGILFFNEGLTKYGYLGIILNAIGALILGLAQTNII
jgi:hypothetical protein